MTELIVLLFSSPYIKIGIFGAIMAMVETPCDLNKFPKEHTPDKGNKQDGD